MVKFEGNEYVVYNPGKIKIQPAHLQKIVANKSYLVFHFTKHKGDKKINSLLGHFKAEIPPEKKLDVDKSFWYCMPEYEEHNAQNFPYIRVGFLNDKQRADFLEKLNLPNNNQRFVHYPEYKPHPLHNLEYKITYKINPIYPIYIISKGRWESRYTVKALERGKIPYKIVVEPSEYSEYSKVIDKRKIIELPSNFSELGRGGIPARNFVWEHASRKGHKKHWILDDNIRGFQRWNKSKKWDINSGVVFRLIEKYVSKFTNIKQAGMQYAMFYPARDMVPPISFNNRIFSCILIDNEFLDKHLKERWRGAYNEDVDLSIRILKKGFATCLFNAFLIQKPATLTVKGGNTDSIYDKGAEEKLRLKAESLVKQHPDIARVVKRYKRGIHHEVDYSKFANNELGFKGKKIYQINNYNMELH